MKKSYKLENLGCPSCAAKMEDAIVKIDGVEDVRINFLTSKLRLELDENTKNSIDDILTQSQKEITKIERDCKIVR